MLNTAPVLRVLRPKITPAAMVRRQVEVAASIAITTATLGLTCWAAYLDAWGRVMFPGERRDGR